MRILGFGTYDGSTHPRVEILLAGLRRQGCEVLEANAPLGFSTAERVAMAQNSASAYRFALRLARRWLTLTVRSRRTARRHRPDAVLVGYLGHFDVVLARLLFPRTTVVLDQLIFGADTARDRGVTGGLKLWLLHLIDRLAVRCADLVVLDTEEHVGLLPEKARSKAVVAAVGAPYEWFVAPLTAPPDALAAGRLNATAEEEAREPMHVVFFGLFTPLQGAPVIGRAIALLPTDLPIRISMFGAGQDLAETRSLAGEDHRVSWRDWVDPANLPSEVAAHDVCLGIFGTTPKAGRVVPNKVFQGAAAGCAVVTSDTEPQRRTLGDAALLIPAGDPDALAAALIDLCADHARLAELKAAAHELADREFRPERVVEPLLAALQQRSN